MRLFSRGDKSSNSKRGGRDETSEENVVSKQGPYTYESLTTIPLINSDYGWNLLYADEDTGMVGHTSADPYWIDFTSYAAMAGVKPEDASARYLLNSLNTYGGPPENYFKLLLHTTSPRPLFDLTLIDEKIAARNKFFEQLNHVDIATKVDDYDRNGVSCSSYLAVFNPGALAMLSLPAFAALAMKGYWELGDSGLWVGGYNLVLPDSSIQWYLVDSFADYVKAFFGNNLVMLNVDTFVTIYALASCIDRLSRQIAFEVHTRGHKLSSISEITNAPFFCDLFDYLINIGALHSPFANAPFTFKVSPTGIENADEANPYLAAALFLASNLQPFPLDDSYTGATLSIFYGLIDYFGMHDYFCIDQNVKFIYPNAPAGTDTSIADDVDVNYASVATNQLPSEDDYEEFEGVSDSYDLSMRYIESTLYSEYRDLLAGSDMLDLRDLVYSIDFLKGDALLYPHDKEEYEGMFANCLMLSSNAPNRVRSDRFERDFTIQIMRNYFLMRGVVNNSITEVRQALKRGANVNERCMYNRNRWSPIVAAAKFGSAAIVQTLIEAGADVNARQDNGETAIALASCFNRYSVAKLLLENGANPNVTARGIGGENPLSQAGDLNMLRLLIDYGADPNIEDNDGDQPIITMISTRKKAETVFLYQAGTDVNHKNRQGYSARDFCWRYFGMEIDDLVAQSL